jgi:secreted trypsin-like serine protease
MKRILPPALRALGAAAALCGGSLLSGCTGGENVGFDEEPLRSDATEYPEAVLVDANADDGSGAACSGTVIAPKVVLTAGHCVVGFTSWAVTAPNAADSDAVSSSDSDVFDYVQIKANTVNPALHDVGLVFLDRAITLDAYPAVAQSGAADGAEAVTIGRRMQVGGGDTEVSTDELFMSDPFQIQGAGASAPFDYTSLIEIDHGDSGGPLMASGASPHVILAVNSGGLTSASEYARVDLVYSWIHEAILAHGGPGK